MVTQTIGSRPKCTCLALMVCEEASILLGRILVQCSFLVWYFCYFRYIYIYIYRGFHADIEKLLFYPS